jgi:hypothetical protein
MSSKTAAHANRTLQLILANADATGLGLRGSTTAGNLSIGLFVGDPRSGGAEISYTGYARATLSRASGSWTFVTSGNTAEARLATDLTFPRRTNSGATVTAAWVGVHDQADNLLYAASVSTPSGGLVIREGDAPQLLATSTKFTEA